MSSTQRILLFGVQLVLWSDVHLGANHIVTKHNYGLTRPSHPTDMPYAAQPAKLPGVEGSLNAHTALYGANTLVARSEKLH